MPPRNQNAKQKKQNVDVDKCDGTCACLTRVSSISSTSIFFICDLVCRILLHPTNMCQRKGHHNAYGLLSRYYKQFSSFVQVCSSVVENACYLGKKVVIGDPRVLTCWIEETPYGWSHGMKGEAESSLTFDSTKGMVESSHGWSQLNECEVEGAFDPLPRKKKGINLSSIWRVMIPWKLCIFSLLHLYKLGPLGR